MNADFLAITSQDQPFAGKGRLGLASSRLWAKLVHTQPPGHRRVRSVHAEIYRLPVVLAILSFIDPTSSPSPEAFNFAKVHFRGGQPHGP